MVRVFAAAHFFTCAQAGQVVETFQWEREKVEVALILFGRVVDPQRVDLLTASMHPRLKEEVMGDLNKLAKAASEVNGGVGVYAIASTLGSLEALLEFLKTSKIPVSAVNIGPIHKKDVIKASIMHEHKSEFATILAFDVPITKEGGEQAKELNVKVDAPRP